MKKTIMTQEKLVFILVMLIIGTVILIGCKNDKKTGDTTSSGPSVEELDNKPIHKKETIKIAIRTCEEIVEELESMDEIESAVVFINHESVLVALKLEESHENITSDLRNKIEIEVKKIYLNAKTIAISKDEYVFESISRLIKSFKEDKTSEELKKDIEEIIRNF
ncbi:MAG: YhcN/YlaJ family sporulation lipoprotein [Clostridium sp.]|uniref:YhcN/YlaJ family sporulation lipoprotein n=1 Tax=Clostridium sp. TaxID=1506 RepID=UPI0030637AEE